ncbi:MAG: hypothetical protein IJR59_07865 [Firmicutes bacterium]|nr:hypothetical protein [Bacillota bacterium]
MRNCDEIIKKHNTLFAVLAAFVTGTAFLRVYGVTTASDAALWVLLFLIPFYKKTFSQSGGVYKNMPSLCGIFFALAYTAANLSKFLSYGSVWETIFSLFCSVVGFYAFFKSAVKLLYGFLWDKSAAVTRVITVRKKTAVFFGSTAIVLLCRIPYFMYVFPGNVLYDSVMQLLMAEGAIHLSNHHPVPHTLFIKFFFELGIKLFGSQTAGVALHSAVQCILMSLAFGYVVETMYSKKINKYVLFAVLAYYCLMPYHSDYSFTMLKDVMFGGITAVLCAVLWRMTDENGGKIKIRDIVMFFVFAVLFCLFRSNAFIAFVLLVPFLLAVFAKRSKTAAVVSVLALITAAVIKGPVYNMCDIHHTDIMESFAVPAQHIGRTLKDGGQLTNEQYKLLSNIVEVEKIPETYYPTIADPLKELVREKDNIPYLEANKGKFFKLWLELGLKYPKSYLLAQIDETSGYFYPDARSWVYGTIDFSGETYGFDIHKIPLMSEKAYNNFTAFINLYKNIHYVGLLWSIGMMCWVMVFMAGLCYAKSMRRYVVVYIPVMAVIATLMIATPVNTEFRYVYSLFTAIPIFCVLPFAKKQKTQSSDSASIQDL